MNSWSIAFSSDFDFRLRYFHNKNNDTEENHLFGHKKLDCLKVLFDSVQNIAHLNWTLVVNLAIVFYVMQSEHTAG